MEKRTRQIWLRSSAQSNGRTPPGLHSPACRILRSIQRGPTQSGSQNKILNVLPRVSPADHKLNLSIRPPLPLLAPVKFFRIRGHLPPRNPMKAGLRSKEFVLIRVKSRFPRSTLRGAYLSTGSLQNIKKITKRTHFQKYDLPANKGDSQQSVSNLDQKRTHFSEEEPTPKLIRWN
jgi:hypothetical protein